MLTSEIKDLLRLGVNLDLTQTQTRFLTSELKDFLRIVVMNEKAHLTISSKGLLTSEIKDLIRIGREQLTIVIQ